MTEKAGPASGSKVSAALSEAQTIVEAAKRRATELEEQAQRKYQEAWDAGFRHGSEKAREDAARAAIRLAAESSSIGERLAEEAAKLALVVASTVVGDHVKTNPGTVIDVARRALQDSIVGGTVKIIVHPEDRAQIEPLRREFSRIADGAEILVEEDAALTRGGCTIRTEFGEVDASIEALIESAAQRLGVPRHA